MGEVTHISVLIFFPVFSSSSRLPLGRLYRLSERIVREIVGDAVLGLGNAVKKILQKRDNLTFRRAC